jgi:hypothetical protein
VMKLRRFMASPPDRAQTTTLSNRGCVVRHSKNGAADVRSGSCVTSIAGPNGGAQLYER